jgi:hypothetical protein
MGIFKKEIITFKGYDYYIDLIKLKEICLSSTKDVGTKEIQIAQTYEMDERGEFELQTKVEHETKTMGNTQNDMIIYDIVKILLISLLENTDTEEEFKMTFGLQLAINTLLSWGILVKINNKN